MGHYAKILLLAVILVVSQAPPARAQSWLSRLTQKGAYLLPGKAKKHKRIKCGYMNAYNKRKAYRQYKRSNGGKTEGAPTTYTPHKRLKRSEILAQKYGEKFREPASQNSTPPSVLSASTSNSVAATAPRSVASPRTESDTNPKPDNRKSAPGSLTREALKSMSEQQRRDTLERTTPTETLPPIQFISDQDEFSVVNMDSFMKAMEYAQQGKVVLIEGHTDDLGREQYNLDLSMKRTEKIRQLLLSAGVADELISVIGYGESRPVVPNTSTENRAINRRIEFKIFDLSQ